jgi:hypothetical protein
MRYATTSGGGTGFWQALNTVGLADQATADSRTVIYARHDTGGASGLGARSWGAVSAVLILPDETHLDLGSTFQVYKDFAEIARAVGPDFFERYPDFGGLMTQIEWNEPCDPSWLADAGKEASSLLATYGDSN